MASRPSGNTLHGLVLAGGKSRRMGQDKARLVRGGQSQLAYVVRLLEGLVARVFVSTRADQHEETERSQFKQIIDSYQDIGPVAGIVGRFAADNVVCPRKILMRSDTLLLQQGNPHALDNVNTPEDLQGSQLEAAS